jgi:hypothetical protein
MIDTGTYAAIDNSRHELRFQFKVVVDGTASFENPLKRYQYKLQAVQTGDPVEERVLALEDKIAQLDRSPAAMIPSDPSKYAAFNRGILDRQTNELERFLTGNLFKMYFNPTADKIKIIGFDPAGSIREGRNDNEFGWRVRGGRLEILQSDGNVHSRLVFVPSDRSFQHTNDPDTRSLMNQRIEIAS